ncbi:rabl3 [Symbiodinium microadriaticum]|nr:rabl3 [Symbiodinium microadriaticum]CAE7767885.1 rabl3 [Symbiodinium sp. KB8]
MAVDASGQGPDSDNYNKENDPTTRPDVETRVQKLNFLSRSRPPSTQKAQERSESKDGKARKEKSEKKSEPRAEEEAHVLGAWLLDEKVVELLKIHQDARKKGSGATKSQPEVSTKAMGKGTSKTIPEAVSDAGPNAPAVDSSTASAGIQGQMSSSVKPSKTLISL